ncbi:MAG: NAD(P)H-hydrate epimerase [Terrimesophilobacter sp.]
MDAMINGYTAEQVRAAEAPLLAAGVPLMALAAAGLAREIQALLPDTGGKVLVLAGSGDNGGDALYAGAELAAGAKVTIVPTGSRVHEPALAAALAAGAHLTSLNHAARLAAEADVLVDGIVGTGTSANPALRGGARDVVEAILPVLGGPGRPLVVAVDIPSGINPNDGSVPRSRTAGTAAVLPADLTVTFGGYKAGLFLPPASVLAGRVVLIDIGLGPELDRMVPAIRSAGGESPPAPMRAGQTGTNAPTSN